MREFWHLKTYTYPWKHILTPPTMSQLSVFISNPFLVTLSLFELLQFVILTSLVKYQHLFVCAVLRTPVIKGHYDLFVTNRGILKCREINWSPISFYLLQVWHFRSSKSPEVDSDSKESALKEGALQFGQRSGCTKTCSWLHFLIVTVATFARCPPCPIEPPVHLARPFPLEPNN